MSPPSSETLTIETFAEGAAPPPTRERLEATCRVDEMRPLLETLERRVHGQHAAVDALACSFARLLSGLHDPQRPLLTALLLGPTGVGKTETARALTEALFGSDQAMTRINCEEYAHGHEISKLLGSPPGYVGHNIEPLLSQARLEEAHRKLRGDASPGEENHLLARLSMARQGAPVSVVLFDEVEKAHPTLWNALLGVLEDGVLTLGNNTTVDFTRSIVLMTSNVGSHDLGEFLGRRAIGFSGLETEPVEDEEALRQVAIDAAKIHFPDEFLNRFDEMLVYAALGREDLEAIFDKFLEQIHRRVLKYAKMPVELRLQQEAKELIIDKGTEPRYGARPLRRTVERELVDPLSRFIASQALAPGDVLEVEREGDGLAFFRTARAVTPPPVAAAEPVVEPRPEVNAPAAAALPEPEMSQ